jgi:alcohol dehydrogenase (NADP+)
MTKKIPAYGARVAKGPLAPMTIERRELGPDDLDIRILYCGICHSDVHKVNNDWGNTHFPIVPGHEIIGRVEAKGSSALRFQVGDLVGVGCIVDSCRVCRECHAGREMFCEKGVTFTFDSLERDGRTLTDGGYSSHIVVHDRYALHIPSSLDPARAAPLLCAGITTFSPLRQYDCKPGQQVGVMGLGGLGHMAVKFATAMGGEVTVFSSSHAKEADAKRLGAKHFVATADKGALESLEGKFDLIVDTVSGSHDLNQESTLLRNFGTIVLVGLPPTATNLDVSLLVHGNKRVAGSNIGGILETQEMLYYCGKHGIVADVEKIEAKQINDAYARMQRGDVRYRFVIDAASIGESTN